MLMQRTNCLIVDNKLSALSGSLSMTESTQANMFSTFFSCSVLHDDANMTTQKSTNMVILLYRIGE